MKITDVETLLATCPLAPEHQWRTAQYRVLYAHAVVVRVRTDAGVEGIGEPSPYGGPARIKEFLDTKLRPRLLGKDPARIEELTAVTEDSFETLCLSGVNQALWDIAGKVAGKPTYQLLARPGEAVDEIEAYASGGVNYVWWDRPESLIDEAVDWQSKGFRFMKLRVGSDWAMDNVTPDRFLKLIENLLATLGPDGMKIAVDCNMRLRSVDEALSVGLALERMGIVWYEEPIPIRGDTADYAKLAKALKVPVTGLEGAPTLKRVLPYLDAGAIDIVQTDCNVSGMSENRRIAAECHSRGLRHMPHSWHHVLTTVANAHHVAAIPNRWLLEYNMTANPLIEILDEPFVPKNGRIKMPKAPGFGVRLNESALERFPFTDKPYHVLLERPK
jgi:L-alanine-DL-glutamate epimerase-like enolase superfamily enzyme